MVPSAEMVTALVNEGWSFRDLMAMGAGEFMFWFSAQSDLSEARNKASQPKA